MIILFISNMNRFLPKIPVDLHLQWRPSCRSRPCYFRFCNWHTEISGQCYCCYICILYNALQNGGIHWISIVTLPHGSYNLYKISFLHRYLFKFAYLFFCIFFCFTLCAVFQLYHFLCIPRVWWVKTSIFLLTYLRISVKFAYYSYMPLLLA